MITVELSRDAYGQHYLNDSGGTVPARTDAILEAARKLADVCGEPVRTSVGSWTGPYVSVTPGVDPKALAETASRALDDWSYVS